MNYISSLQCNSATRQWEIAFEQNFDLVLGCKFAAATAVGQILSSQDVSSLGPGLNFNEMGPPRSSFLSLIASKVAFKASYTLSPLPSPLRLLGNLDSLSTLCRGRA